VKDVLLLHDNSRPHTSLRTREAIAKLEWTVLPHPAHSPDLAPSDYHLFRPVTNMLSGRHFADNNELKQSFRDVVRSRGQELYNAGIQSLTQRWQKCVENDYDSVGKQPHNCKLYMNYPRKFHCYCNYIFRVKTGGITFVQPLVYSLMFMFRDKRQEEQILNWI
jgi:hypothetical protein